MANEKIEDVIKKVILGEGFLAENAEEQDTPEGEDTSDEDAIAEEEVYEDGEEIVEEEELEEAKDEESEEEEEEDEEEEEEDEEEDEEDSKGKKKMPAFLKGKFGKKGKKKMEEAVSDYADKKMYQDANGKGASIPAPTGDASGKNKATIKAKPSAAKAETKIPEVKPTVKEDIAVLLSGQELSEDFKASAATLFEAHLNERTRQIEEEVQAKYESLLEQHTVAVTEELVERIDDYLNYVVEEWMQENRLAVEQGLRTEITENFIGNLRSLFAESYIEVPEEKLDLFESTVEQAEVLDGELHEQVEKNMELAEEIEQLKCEIVFREIAEGLADTDSEKLRRLAEDLEFDTVEQFAEKLGVLRENIETIGSTVTEGEATEESLEESYEDASEASPLVEAVARSMSKSRE
jgi:hypothetical protein